MFRSNSAISVVYPNVLMKGMKKEGIMISPVDVNIGIAALSEKEYENQILRLYQLVREENTYHFSHELAAFRFTSYHELDPFLQKLPAISGLEMLMLLNPYPEAFN
ncbi:hypothetical protein [Niallia sp. 03133]|uniref:hypothetical protein n=1 Tax=Niallia sp. 03133 TaxID=3458060 RepID=UPI004044B767